MRQFEVLFDHGEPSPVSDDAYAPYGHLGFPEPPGDRPWIYSNFVQSIDGIASFLGKKASGFNIARLAEDRWLMDLLRAHADAVILGINTLIVETAVMREDSGGERKRGPVFRIAEPKLKALRARLGRGPEMNIFVTSGATLDPSLYQVFDGNKVQPVILTTRIGAEKLSRTDANVRVLVAGDEQRVDMRRATTMLRSELGIRYLLCEGGPTLNGYMSRAGMIDERFLTIAPIEIGLRVPPEQETSVLESTHPPVERPTTFCAPGFLAETAPAWSWVSCRRIGNHEFNRYRRVRTG
ncbi:MAG: dihydrofolate reductase family protein [Acidobacteriaceae bacterium]|nr:dihydrofolate reductase family protein [Acidobacteriaceae bacterium]